MLTYEALIEEISVIEAARESLPRDVHVGGLFELAIGRLTDQADALMRIQHGDGVADRLRRNLPGARRAAGGHDDLRMAS